MLSAMGVPVNKNIPSAQDQVIKIAALSAESFKELFYSVCDAHRDEAFHFFRDNSLMVWNGTKVSGASNIKEFFRQLPRTKHSISAFDAQPIFASGSPQNVASYMVTVNGKVSFGIGSSSQHNFHQSFVLERDVERNPNSNNAYYIVSCVMRSEDSSKETKSR